MTMPAVPAAIIVSAVRPSFATARRSMVTMSSSSEQGSR